MIIIPAQIEDTLNALESDVENFGASFSMGQKAVIADRLEKLAKALMDDAKAKALDHMTAEGLSVCFDEPAMFTLTKASVSEALDSAAVRRVYPPSAFPQFYKTRERAAYVAVKIGKPVEGQP